MSYNFSISRVPIPEDVDNPWEWINTEIEKAQEPHPDFIKLHTELTKKYPCICDLPDDEIDEGVWSDGPLINNFSQDNAVLGLAYSAVEEVGGDIFSIIVNNGFYIFDYQSETIYGPS